MPGPVVVVGSFNVDHVWRVESLPRAGETLQGCYTSGPGGKGFNQAVAAARSGAPTHFVCALGDDLGGQLARMLARDEGIHLHAQPSDAPTGTAGIQVDREGRNHIVIGPGANDALDAGFVQGRAELLADAAVVLAQCEVPCAAVLSAFERARAQGGLTVLNPAPANVDIPQELWAATSIATPNETELAAHLARRHGIDVEADALSTLDDDALHAVARRFLPRGDVVVTLGAAGVFFSPVDGSPLRVSAPRVHTVDTTGAGDAFNGALAAALAVQRAVDRGMLLQAVRYASLATETPGAALAMPLAIDVAGRFGACAG
ncbi:ribokinase [Lysobacter sp. SG-8]|uniref:Ribokinase n=1 Tax=Marilutibacter penaei TaxID=2759900 RepID=A0A7W3YEH6_9GAMM|nr:ribokinase [Lysobacter penaei]MBB1088231.1 ribokinase [Lysobacter penaei]